MFDVVSIFFYNKRARGAPGRAGARAALVDEGQPGEAREIPGPRGDQSPELPFDHDRLLSAAEHQDQRQEPVLVHPEHS